MRKVQFSIILSLVLLFSVSMVMAQESPVRFYHEYGTGLEILEQCRVSGFPCDSSFDCNISILDPDQNILISQESMGTKGTYRNYTLNSTQTIPNGLYEYTTDCNNGTNAGSNVSYYQITPDGSQPIDTGQGIILIIGFYVLIVVSVSLGYMSMRTNNTTVMLSFLSLSILLMVFALGYSLSVIELSFGTFSGIINSYSALYVLGIILVSAGGVALLLYLIFVALNYYWNLRGMKDTVSVRT